MGVKIPGGGGWGRGLGEEEEGVIYNATPTYLQNEFV